MNELPLSCSNCLPGFLDLLLCFHSPTLEPMFDLSEPIVASIVCDVRFLYRSNPR